MKLFSIALPITALAGGYALTNALTHRLPELSVSPTTVVPNAKGEATVVIRNLTDRSLELRPPDASCGCVVPEAPARLAPFASAKVTLHVSPDGQAVVAFSSSHGSVPPALLSVVRAGTKPLPKDQSIVPKLK